MSTCELCVGRLRVFVADTHNAEPLSGKYEPCPRCLTTPATDEIRAVSLASEGCDRWGHDGRMVVYHGQSPWFTACDRAAVAQAPAYLSGGRDLLVRVLAKRRELAAAPAYRWTPHGRGWQLCTDPWSEDGGNGLVLFRAFDDFSGHPEVPGLATIPKDAPPDLRAGRALVLCLEALERSA